MSKNDGGPAFPLASPAAEWDADKGGWRATSYAITGMTLRDYFAAKAMHSILSHLSQGIRPQDCIKAAEDAYFIADAMLKARDA